MSGKTVRVFWAVRPAGAAIAAAAESIRALKQPCKQLGLDMGWVPPESMHVTLKFLGDVAEGALGDMVDRVTRGLAGLPPLLLSIGGLGVFPAPRRPQVLFAGAFEDAPGQAAQLGALQARLEDLLAELGHPREERAFHPHLTLGRVRRAAPDAGREAAVSALLDAHRDLRCGPPSRIAELILYESSFSGGGSGGPVYTPLARLPLSA